MAHLLWDASALTKRCYKESGSETVNALFAARPALLSHTSTFMGYAETAAVLLRKRNGDLLSPLDFADARTLLQQEVLLNPAFGLLSVEDADFLSGIALADRHNLNASDAAMLAAFLRWKQSQPAAQTVLLLAADLRLLRAAEAEGLPTLNPETLPAARLAALVSGGN